MTQQDTHTMVASNFLRQGEVDGTLYPIEQQPVQQMMQQQLPIQQLQQMPVMSQFAQQPVMAPQQLVHQSLCSVNDPYLTAPIRHGSFSVAESFSSCEGMPSAPPTPPPTNLFSGASTPTPQPLNEPAMLSTRKAGSFRHDPYNASSTGSFHHTPQATPQQQPIQPPPTYQYNDTFADIPTLPSQDFPTRASMESNASSLSNSGHSAAPLPNLVESGNVYASSASIQPCQPRQPMQPEPLCIDRINNNTPPPTCPSPASSHGGYSNVNSAHVTPNSTPKTAGLSPNAKSRPGHGNNNTKKDKKNILVEYKHGRKGVCTLPSTAISARCEADPNSYIVVEGDRGIDICRIINLTVRKSADAPGLKHPMVIREAKAEEVEYWSTRLAEREEAALKVVNDMVTRSKLPLVVTHAAYQLDKKKLTFIYESPQHQPDFRCLLSECYAVWKCRIWFTCLPKKVSKPSTTTA